MIESWTGPGNEAQDLDRFQINTPVTLIPVYRGRYNTLYTSANDMVLG